MSLADLIIPPLLPIIHWLTVTAVWYGAKSLTLDEYIKKDQLLSNWKQFILLLKVLINAIIASLIASLIVKSDVFDLSVYIMIIVPAMISATYYIYKNQKETYTRDMNEYLNKHSHEKQT